MLAIGASCAERRKDAPWACQTKIQTTNALTSNDIVCTGTTWQNKCAPEKMQCVKSPGGVATNDNIKLSTEEIVQFAKTI